MQDYNTQDYKKKIETEWRSFLSSNQYIRENYHIDEEVLFVIGVKVEQRKEYYKIFHKSKLTVFQEIALICFWILKFHPITIIDFSPDDNNDELINEKFTLYFIVSFFRKLVPNDTNKISNVFFEEYMKELIYSFRYRDISKEAMVLLVETIAIALEINPYIHFKKRKNESANENSQE